MFACLKDAQKDAQIVWHLFILIYVCLSAEACFFQVVVSDVVACCDSYCEATCSRSEEKKTP